MKNAYIINLERHIDRKNALEKNIKDKNIDNFINFEFIKAIEGAKLTEEDKKQFSICPIWIDPLLQSGITSGEVGCSLSHYNAWKKFYESGEDFALFFEDDIYFLDNFETNFKHFLEYPQDADIVYIKRKPLSKNFDIVYDDYFYKIKASYWLCGYLLTKKGVEKIVNQSNYLNNLIVVDEFLPILYDNNYLNYYKQYYNTSLNAYSIKEEYCFINLTTNTFFESSTFHSNYFSFDSQIVAISSDLNVSNSSIQRFKKSCEKYSIQYKFIDFIDIINVLNNEIDNNKFIILLNCNYSFFINNPIKLIIEDNKDLYYSNFNNLDEIILNYNNNNLFFFGKKEILLSILNNNFDKSKIKFEENICELLEKNTTSINNSNKIIVSGFMNPLLVNKYENHKMNKCKKSYGYKNINETNVKFKIRINILMYDNTLLDCYNSIRKIDYPKEFLDINVYSLSDIFINDDSIKIHKITEKNAYLNIYSYYNDYDYIWIVNSNNIITEPSLLNDLIYSNKSICSGLVKKGNTYFTNFWGGITEKGWYLRSDDYLDIINLSIYGLWNVPYITGNILISKEIFNSYDIFKDNSFNDFDMILCHNLRLLNEGMYLLNTKVYGYFLDKPAPINTENVIIKKEQDINNWTIDKIFSPEYLKFFNSDDMSIFNEVEKGSDIWCFPFFTHEFCDYLVNFAETNGKWSGGVFTKGTVDKRLGAVENIPTQDIHLKDLGIEPFWLEIINNHFKKIMSKLYHYKTKDYNIAFIVKYDAERGQTSLQPHHDSSVYTTNIALCSDSEYDGGGVKFHSKNITFFNKNKGWLCLHPGRVTHYHEALPITKGLRYVLISFNN
jgi:GR25 family glycosyltransferase involved in LPS biosynthesis